MREYQIGDESLGAGAATVGIGATKIGTGVAVEEPEPESTTVKV